MSDAGCKHGDVVCAKCITDARAWHAPECTCNACAAIKLDPEVERTPSPIQARVLGEMFDVESAEVVLAGEPFTANFSFALDATQNDGALEKMRAVFDAITRDRDEHLCGLQLAAALLYETGREYVRDFPNPGLVALASLAHTQRMAAYVSRAERILRGVE
jgi:hypothetical protein